MKMPFRLFPLISPDIAHYPVVIQKLLKKGQDNFRSIEAEEEFKQNLAALDRLELMSRHDPVMRLLLWVIGENVRKDFQIYYMRKELAKIRGEIRCLKSGQDPAEKSS